MSDTMDTYIGAYHAVLSGLQTRGIEFKTHTHVALTNCFWFRLRLSFWHVVRKSGYKISIHLGFSIYA